MWPDDQNDRPRWGWLAEIACFIFVCWVVACVLPEAVRQIMDAPPPNATETPVR